MSQRLAVHLGPHQLPELQRAARILLARPLVTAADGDEFRLIRRWETILRTEFSQKLGYRLDISRSAARLLRRPATLSAHRGGSLSAGHVERSLSRWAYVYLCLILAALEHPGTQVLASELVDRIEQGARGDDELQLDAKEYAQRRAFRDAIRFLEQIGVLAVRDGDVDSLATRAEHDGQVLFDVDRDAAAMCLVATPSILREVRTVDDFIAEPEPTNVEARRRQARQRLNRRMIDQPVVLLDDLDDDEAELAWRNRRREAENISRLTGCSIELRREGIALIDQTAHPISRRRFPGSDSVAHGALLWLDELLALAAPTDEPNDQDQDQTGGRADDGAGAARLEIRRQVQPDDVAAAWTRVTEAYGTRLGKASREQPDKFRHDCKRVLEEFGLIRAVSGTDGTAFDVTAFANRFRPSPTMVGSELGTTSRRLTSSQTSGAQQVMF